MHKDDRLNDCEPKTENTQQMQNDFCRAIALYDLLNDCC